MNKPFDPTQQPSQPTEPPAQRQLDRLFGESLFGAWPESRGALSRAHGPGRKRGPRRLGVGLLVAALAVSGFWYFGRHKGQQVSPARDKEAAEVASLLAEGALERLAQGLGKLAPAGKPLLADDPHLDLIVAAEAALYRYQDAAPERLGRIEPFLSRDSGQPARLLAGMTVASRPERVAAYDSLNSLAPTHAQGSEYHALAATIHEERGDMQAARASWQRSFQAGPRWLPHRYLQCAFEARQGDSAAAARIAEHMGSVAPDSPWTRLARQQAGDTQPTAAAPIPVALYFAELAPVLRGLGARDLSAARQAIGRAFDAVHGQAAFVLDAYRALRAAKADNLAMELTSYETWPRGNAWAKSALAELQMALAGREQAPTAQATPKAAAEARPSKAVRKKTAGKDASKKVKGASNKAKAKRSPRRK